MKDLAVRDTDPVSTMFTLAADALAGPPRPPAPDTVDASPDSTPNSACGRPSLLDRLDRWFWKARQRELERSLTFATDAADVERRLRDHERALLQRYF